MATVAPSRNPATGRMPARSQNGTATSRRLQKWIVLGVAASLIAGIFVWDRVLKYRLIAKRFGVVEPGKLYRSGQISKWKIESVLLENQICVIIDLNGVDPNDEHQRAEIATANRLNIPLHRCPLGGTGEGNINHYADALEIIHKANQQGQRVLVHCHGGAHRTGAAVAFYRILIQQGSPDDALQEMYNYKCRPKRATILVDYMNRHMKALAQMLVERGVLKQMPATIPRMRQ